MPETRSATRWCQECLTSLGAVSVTATLHLLLMKERRLSIRFSIPASAWMTHGALCVLVARVTTRGRYIKIIAALNETLRYNRKRLCKPSSEFRFPAFAKHDLGIWHPFGICQSACKCLCNTPRASNDT